MSLKNASLAAAHQRAEEDLASFEAREAHAAQRRAADRQNRQAMLGERERNRMRKLKAVEGREWDAEKRDDGEKFAGGRGARRGGYRDRGRGRGAAGRGRGREDGSPQARQQQQ